MGTHAEPNIDLARVEVAEQRGFGFLHIQFEGSQYTFSAASVGALQIVLQLAVMDCQMILEATPEPVSPAPF